MAASPKDQSHLRSYPGRTRCPLPLPRSDGITKIDFEKSGKMWYFSIESGRHIVECWAIRANFCISLQDHTSYVYAKHHWDLCNNKGARARTKIRAYSLEPAPAAASKLSKYIGPTFYMDNTFTRSTRWSSVASDTHTSIQSTFRILRIGIVRARLALDLRFLVCICWTYYKEKSPWRLKRPMQFIGSINLA